MVSQCDESLIWVVTSFELIVGQNELQLTRNLFVVKFVAGQEFVARYGTKRGVRRCVRHDEKKCAFHLHCNKGYGGQERWCVGPRSVLGATEPGSCVGR